MEVFADVAEVALLWLCDRLGRLHADLGKCPPLYEKMRAVTRCPVMGGNGYVESAAI